MAMIFSQWRFDNTEEATPFEPWAKVGIRTCKDSKIIKHTLDVSAVAQPPHTPAAFDSRCHMPKALGFTSSSNWNYILNKLQTELKRDARTEDEQICKLNLNWSANSHRGDLTTSHRMLNTKVELQSELSPEKCIHRMLKLNSNSSANYRTEHAYDANSYLFLITASAQMIIVSG